LEEVRRLPARRVEVTEMATELKNLMMHIRKDSKADSANIPRALGADELSEHVLGNLFNGKILDQVTDVLILLLHKDGSRGLSLGDLFDALERDVLVKALSEFNGHQSKTAKFLGLKPTTLFAKLKKHNIYMEFKGTPHVKDSAVPPGGLDDAASMDRLTGQLAGKPFRKGA
jgi:DNA-binding NtrC family response regulator